MAGYTKLFSSILTSTIWQEPKETKVLWITMLAMANKDGVVEGSVPGLAHVSGLTIDETVAALKRLLEKDFWSRSKEHEGRRIEEIDGGWRLLNHDKYRALMSAEERKEYNRRKQAEGRAKVRGESQSVSANVNDMSMTPSVSGICSLPFDSELFMKAWELWVTHRSEIRKPLKPTSTKMCLKELAAMGEARAIAAIEFTIGKGWQGLREDDRKNGSKTQDKHRAGWLA